MPRPTDRPSVLLCRSAATSSSSLLFAPCCYRLKNQEATIGARRTARSEIRPHCLSSELLGEPRTFFSRSFPPINRTSTIPQPPTVPNIHIAVQTSCSYPTATAVRHIKAPKNNITPANLTVLTVYTLFIMDLLSDVAMTAPHPRSMVSVAADSGALEKSHCAVLAIESAVTPNASGASRSPNSHNTACGGGGDSV